jgi:hypothetical protein
MLDDSKNDRADNAFRAYLLAQDTTEEEAAAEYDAWNDAQQREHEAMLDALDAERDDCPDDWNQR